MKSKILIWGTGTICRELLENDFPINSIIGFIESKKQNESFMGLPVYDAAHIPDGYDFIIVANTYVDDIYKKCMKLGMEVEKVIFLFPTKITVGFSDCDAIREMLGEKNYTNYCARFNRYEDSFFRDDLKEYRRLNKRESFAAKEEYLWPIIADKYAKAGTVHNYFWQDLWAARLIHRSGVTRHFDIGSRMDGFIAHLLAMGIDVTMIDIRKFPKEVDGLHTIVDDATTLHEIPDESIESMSALCSLEHFGLGRYGDSINPEACFICFENIQRKIRQGGHLYISLPVGKERVEFNAHRVFYPETVKNCFNNMELVEFSATSCGDIEYNADIHAYDNDNHNGEYRYGLFHFIKR